GFDFDNRGNLLVSNASGSASSYAVSAGSIIGTISGAVATHQGAPCWLIASKNGRYAYTANAGAGSISGFSVGHDGSLTLLDARPATALDDRPGERAQEEPVSHPRAKTDCDLLRVPVSHLPQRSEHPRDGDDEGLDEKHERRIESECEHDVCGDERAQARDARGRLAEPQ